MSFYINADPHGSYTKIQDFVKKFNLTEDDTIILLGDVAFNYFGDKRDDLRKRWLSSMPCNFYCIQGNHEMRPEHLEQYDLIDFCGGKAWHDKNYKNVYFLRDGDIYNFDNKKCLVLGGAYSVDKDYRLTFLKPWFEDEQMSEESKKYAEENLEKNNWKVDYVFSHTCPISYEPRECFLSFVNQKDVDKTMEMWLGNIEYKLDYEKWFIGHFHTDKTVGKVRFLFDDFESFQDKERFKVFEDIQTGER